MPEEFWMHPNWHAPAPPPEATIFDHVALLPVDWDGWTQALHIDVQPGERCADCGETLGKHARITPVLHIGPIWGVDSGPAS